MNERKRAAGVRKATAIALAGAVMALTPTLRADESPDNSVAPIASAPSNVGVANVVAEVSSASAPRESAPAGTPLVLRPSKPIEIAPEPHGVSAGWKAVAVMGILGGAAFWLRKKRRPALRDDGRLTILRRTTVGLRSELLVVDVEGQRLLLGVTPQSIQSLAVLDGDDVAVPASVAASPASAVADRFDALLDAADRLAPKTAAPKDPASIAEDVRSKSVAEDVAGQARGLLGLRGRR